MPKKPETAHQCELGIDMENKAPKSRLLWSIPCANLFELQLSSPDDDSLEKGSGGDEQQPRKTPMSVPKAIGAEVKKWGIMMWYRLLECIYSLE